MGPASQPEPPKTPEPPTIRSIHTTNFPALLGELGVSLLVTTYQAGRVVVVRADGERLNTHFRTFSAPIPGVLMNSSKFL